MPDPPWEPLEFALKPEGEEAGTGRPAPMALRLQLPVLRAGHTSLMTVGSSRMTARCPASAVEGSG